MLLKEYQNGNALVKLYKDGTRIIEFEGELKPTAPFNVDIRVNTSCSFGFNEKTGKSICSFCHESAVTNGKECDYQILKEKLKPLPSGMELAIGANELSPGLISFLEWASGEGFICNLTVNQGHIPKYHKKLKELLDSGSIYGLGISYRPNLSWKIPEELLSHPNTVLHVISGIDSFSDVKGLAEKGVKKILILGEKDFGFNKGNVDLSSPKHKEWFWWVHELFSIFDVVSFDNLALEQLSVKRFFSDKSWNTFNNGEWSFYINAVDGYFSPSSRSPDKTSWYDCDAIEYFSRLQKFP